MTQLGIYQYILIYLLLTPALGHASDRRKLLIRITLHFKSAINTIVIGFLKVNNLTPTVNKCEFVFKPLNEYLFTKVLRNHGSKNKIREDDSAEVQHFEYPLIAKERSFRCLNTTLRLNQWV